MSASELPLPPSNMLSNIINNIKDNKKTLYIIVGIAVASIVGYIIYKKYFETKKSSKTTQNAPQMTQNAPQMTQNAPQMTQNAPQMTQNVPRVMHNEEREEIINNNEPSEMIYENDDKLTELTASEVERLNQELENS